jgi:hypothetical protein
MFESSSSLTVPEYSSQKMWRYLSARRLQDLLATQELFFAHIPTLDDTKEGMLTDHTQKLFVNWYQNQHNSTLEQTYESLKQYEDHRVHSYVNCWHMNNHESYLMWKAYADRGFAIETTFERLQASLHTTPAAINGGVVNYVDFEVDTTRFGNVFNHVETKDMPYIDEREFRLLFWDIDQNNVNYEKIGNGVRIRVDIKLLIERVVRNPFQAVNSELERLLELNGLQPAHSKVTIKPLAK